MQRSPPQWTFWHSSLVGIPWENWRRLLRDNRVDPGYRHRAVYLSAMSLRASYFRRKEEQRFGAAINATEIAEAPVFVLGHWRSGTTHLHNLLACDTARFAFPTSIQTCYPYTFLTTEADVRKGFDAFTPPTRMMDNVVLNADTPQEDEFGLSILTLMSPYLGTQFFPRSAERYDRYLTFRNVPPAEIDMWKATFRWFAKKLTLGRGRRLLLKSPTHTARIKLLLELFPDAKFVHICRDPHAVFRSSQHLYRKLIPIQSLQRPLQDNTPGILERHTDMYDAYFAQRSLIPPGQLHELRYEDLVVDPIGQISAAYQALDLPGFEAFRPSLQRYVASVAHYETNRFEEPSLRDRDLVAQAWSRSFEAWDYRP
ncbi:MAG: sulfotransferase family protein [Actinomycetota bacterium]